MIVPIAANAVPSAQPPTARLHDELFPVIAGDFVTYRRGILTRMLMQAVVAIDRQALQRGLRRDRKKVAACPTTAESAELEGVAEIVFQSQQRPSIQYLASA
jgi:hypothetical protein